MKTGLTKKQKTTDVYYNAKDPLAEVYTHDTNLKKRLRKYAAKYPELCQLADDDGQGPHREFCVSDFRQNQEYHVFNVHGGGLFPLVTSLPEGWDGMRAVCGVNAGAAFREADHHCE